MRRASAPSRVFVLESNPIFRAGLAGSIDACPELSLCGEAGVELDAPERLAEVQPDVVVVGLSRDGPTDTGLLAMSQGLPTSPPVVLLAELTTGAIVQMAILNGARGYLAKDIEAEELCEALRAAARGVLAISAEASELLREHLEVVP